MKFQVSWHLIGSITSLHVDGVSQAINSLFNVECTTHPTNISQIADRFGRSVKDDLVSNLAAFNKYLKLN